MSSYGTTIEDMAMHAKDVVRHAFFGEVWAGGNDGGDVWEKAGREDCEQAALEEVDNLYYHLNELAASGRAMERIAKAHGLRPDMREYMQVVQEELRMYGRSYVYEQDLREALDGE